MNIIGISGYARHGKDTVGEIIQRHVPHAETLAFADPLKSICGKLYNLSHAQLYGLLKDVPDPRYVIKCPFCSVGGPFCGSCDNTGRFTLTPRFILQKMGTEVARNVYEDTWLDYTLEKTGKLLDGEIIKVDHDVFRPIMVNHPAKSSVVAITDCRFVSEARKIVKRGGIVIRVQRHGQAGSLTDTAKRHASEVEMDTPEFKECVSETIMNDGTLASLANKVERVMLRHFPNLVPHLFDDADSAVSWGDHEDYERL